MNHQSGFWKTPISAVTALFAVLGVSAWAAAGPPAPLYSIEAAYDPDSGIVSGAVTMEFSNSSPDTIREILFITEANAFRHEHTKYAAERQDEYMFRLLPRLFPGKLSSWTEITNPSFDGAPVDAAAWSPGSFADSTLMAVIPPRPLGPGEDGVVGFNFRTKLRRFDGNAGNTRDFAVSGAWCPLPARFGNGEWAAVERLGETRQTGQPSKLECAIDLPEGWGLVASGEKNRSLSGGGNGFSAAGASEFGWFAFKRSRFESAGGLAGNTRFELIYPRSWRLGRFQKAMENISGQLAWFADRLGGTGFETITLVAGTGSEKGDVYYNLAILPDFTGDWPACLARLHTRGTAAPLACEHGWLDTGLAAYLAMDYMRETKGPPPRIPFILNESTSVDRTASELCLKSRLDGNDMLNEPVGAWNREFTRSMQRRTVVFLETLRRLMGDEPFMTGLAAYFAQRVEPGTPESLRKAMESAGVGIDLSSLFTQWVDSRDLVNYGVDDVEVEELEEDGGFQTVVSIERRGDMTVPVELEIGFEDGVVDHRVTGGEDRLFFETFKSVAKPSVVTLDPLDKLFDSDRRDNIDPMPIRFRLAAPGSGGPPPRDSFYFMVFPTLWSNDRDGLLPGLHLDFSYMEDFDRTSIWIAHGIDSGRTHYLAEERIPFRGLAIMGREGDVRIRTGLFEGRALAGVEVSKKRESAWWLSTRAGLGYLEGNNRSWYGDDSWSDEQDIFFDTGVELGLKSDILVGSAAFGLRSGLVFLSSVYDYRKIDFCFRLSTSPELSPLRFRLRSYLGTSDGAVPLQHRFRLGGADPAGLLNRFWARSSGVLPGGVYYHEPGGGNLRAYTSIASGAEGVSALNFDLDLVLLRARPGRPGLAAGLFYDAGRAFGEDIDADLRNTLIDFGMTVSLSGFRIWGINGIWVNMPVYANYPGYADGGGGDEWAARFSFGVEGSLWSGFGGG